jgi:hypothetical protein
MYKAKKLIVAMPASEEAMAQIRRIVDPDPCYCEAHDNSRTILNSRSVR